MGNALTRSALAVLSALPWVITIAIGPIATMTQWEATALASIAIAAALPFLKSRVFVANDWRVALAGMLVGAICWYGAALNAASVLAVAMLVYLGFRIGTVSARRPDLMGIWAYGLIGAALLNALIALLHSGVLTQWPGGPMFLALEQVVSGGLRQRNHYASLQCLAFLAVIWRVRTTSLEGVRWNALLLVGFALGAANAASASRTGGLQLLIVAVMVWWWGGLGHVQTRRVLQTAFGGYLAASLASLWHVGDVAGSALERLLTEQADCNSRITLWDNVWQLVLHHPWRGWGWGELDYAHYVTFYDSERFCAILDNAHNLPLHLAVELGLPASALICLLIMMAIRKGRPWAERDATRQFAWGVLSLISLHSMVEYPLWYGPFLLAAASAIGVLCAREDGTLCSGQATRHAVVASVMLTVGLLLMLGYVAWDYHRIGQLYKPQAARSANYREDTLQKAQQSWVFAPQVRFAELVTTSVTHANAEHVYLLAQKVLHFSPEPRVIEKLIESARLTGREQEARLQEERFAAAFPEAIASWRQRGHP